MSLSSIAGVLLFLCGLQHGGAQEKHFYGTALTFTPKDKFANGSMTVVLRYKTAFTSCTDSATWLCWYATSSCGSETGLEVNTVHNTTDWCQREGILTLLVPNNDYLEMYLSSAHWIHNSNHNGRVFAVTVVDLRTRSDTGKANRSPQTTVIPSLRVPANCWRNFSLLAFDPDGDLVKCKVFTNANTRSTPFLNISANCNVLFNATNSMPGTFVVMLYMEDFANQNITLTDASGDHISRSTRDVLGKIPLQFVLKVDGAVPSCTQGQYLPRFLHPTPANRAQIYTRIGHSIEITINAEATRTNVSELLFSGPHNMKLSGPAQGQFILRWTPSESEDGDHHPVCFVAQATNSGATYQSELRCVIVSVSNRSVSKGSPTAATTTMTTMTTQPTFTIVLPTSEVSISYTPGSRGSGGLRVAISSEKPLTKEDIRTIVLPKLQEEWVKLGLPADILLKLIKLTRRMTTSATVSPTGGGVL